MGFKVIKAGMQTTVQDLGRFGFQQFGMVVSGAMDSLALRLGNVMLGNDEGEAGLECSTIGPTLAFEKAQLIVITGGDLSPRLDAVPIAMWKPIWVAAGSQLSFGKPVSGCRAYICFYGGLQVPPVLHSQSTYLKAQLGGWKGRALEKGDQIAFVKPYAQPAIHFNWRVAPQLYVDLARSCLRVIEGPHFSAFTTASIDAFNQQTFAITPMADRMGYRLEGPTLTLAQSMELLSSAVTFGTVQVPPQGQAIVLMADHPTTGGYPVLAQVARVDLPLLAQKRPADLLRFQLISLAEAQAALRMQEKQIQQLKRSIAFAYAR